MFYMGLVDWFFFYAFHLLLSFLLFGVLANILLILRVLNHYSLTKALGRWLSHIDLKFLILSHILSLLTRCKIYTGWPWRQYDLMLANEWVIELGFPALLARWTYYLMFIFLNTSARVTLAWQYLCNVIVVFDRLITFWLFLRACKSSVLLYEKDVAQEQLLIQCHHLLQAYQFRLFARHVLGLHLYFYILVYYL